MKESLLNNFSTVTSIDDSTLIFHQQIMELTGSVALYVLRNQVGIYSSYFQIDEERAMASTEKFTWLIRS